MHQPPPKKHFVNKGIQVAPKTEQAIATLNKEASGQGLNSKYEATIKYLQQKLNAYKTEYLKERAVAKQQEKMISGYEQVFDYLNKKKERDYAKLIERVKVEAGAEISLLRAARSGDLALIGGRQQADQSI